MRQSAIMNNRRWVMIQCICLAVLVILAPVLLARADGETEVSLLFTQIMSGNKKIRDLADYELWQVSNESIAEALPILKTALKDKDSHVRRIAAEAIGRVNSNAAVDAVLALKAALEDSDELVRIIAASSLGRIGQGAISEAVQALKGGLNDKSPSVRLLATRAIGQIGQPAGAAVDNLIELAKDTNQNQLIRRAAVGALADVIRGAPTATPESLAALQSSLKDGETLVRVSAATAIGHIGTLAEPLVPELQAALKDNQESVRRAAVNALGEIARGGIEEARRALEKELTASRADVRLFTFEVFGRTGLSIQNLVALFLGALSDHEPKMRRAATIALGNMKPAVPEVISALEKGLTDEDKSVREASASTLGRMGSISSEAIVKFYSLLKDTSAEVRRAAGIALGNLKPPAPETIVALKETLGDENKSVRQAAVWALVTLGSTPPDAVPILQLMLRDPETEIRRGAVVALGRIGPGAIAAVSSLVDHLRDPKQEVRQAAVEALGSMGPLVTVAIHPLMDVMMDHRESSNIRQAAADTLGKMGQGARESIPSIRDAMRDDNEQISSAAARALAKVGSPVEIVPSLIDDVQSQSRAMRRAALMTLSAMGPDAKDAVPVLLKTLNDQQADVSSQEHLGSMAARALGEIGLAARSAVPALINALDNERTRYGAARALTKLVLKLQDAGATETIPSLELAYGKLSESKVLEVKDLDTMRLAIDNLKYRQKMDWLNRLGQFLAQYPLLAPSLLLYLVLLGLVTLVYWFSPLRMLRLNDFSLSSGITIRNQYFETTIHPGQLLLIGFLCYQPRVLDAWIGKHVGVARQEFRKRSTVWERLVHISLPVLCDGDEITCFSPANIRSTFEGGQGCVLIWGEGGAGKTSLACLIAQWAMAEDPSVRLCKHLMIPVLIEEDLNNLVSASPFQLSESVRGQLRTLLHLEDQIPHDLLRHLLVKKRVLVIMDHLSEMSPATREKVRPGDPEFPVNALVVTSRTKNELEGRSKVVIQPLRVHLEMLVNFIKRYLHEKGKNDLLTDPAELFEECKRLSFIAGKRGITILLAKLYIDLLIARKEGHVDDQLPNNVPELMVHYLNLINGRATEHGLDDVAVQRVAKIIAWECLKQSFSPTQAARDTVVHALSDEVSPENALRYLEDRLHLITTVGPEKKQVKFTLDPLAEYLAAMQLVELCGNDETRWREFLEKADSVCESREQISEFLSAVKDSCLSKSAETHLPEYVLRELARRLSPELMA